MTAADKRYARRFAVLGAVFLAVLLGSLLLGRYALSPGQLLHMLWTKVTGGAADWPLSDDKVVFAVRHYRADGSDVERTRYDVWAKGGKPLSETCPASMSDAWPEEFRRDPSDYVIVKPRFSAFFHTELDLILRRLGVDTVLLAGTTTPNCIRSTFYDALSLDYDAVLLSDCTSSVTPAVQQANLADMQRVGGRIMTAADLEQLLG
jgi:nicotinamidase-related amidase